MRIALFLLIFLLPGSAFANAERFCRVVAAHVPGDDVTYKPGLDVHGKDVAPADVKQTLNNVPDPIVIPIEIDILKRFNINVPADMKMDAAAGMVEIYQDGRVVYNEQDISKNALALCSEAASTVEWAAGPEVELQGLGPVVEGESK